MNSSLVYLDNAASTPMRLEVVEVMNSMSTENYGNPSGVHRMARDARRQIDNARDILAAGLGCKSGEIVFTSGGTEADNLAVFGVNNARGGAVVCSAVEHPAVLEPVEHLGGRVVPVASSGLVDLGALASALDDTVALVSVMLVNNETGVIQPLGPLAEVVHERAPNALIHTDAVQAFPWLDVAKLAESADLISVAAHKFGGPKGVGALAVREGASIFPQLLGGGQERGLRSGTHNVVGIIGMAVAAERTISELEVTNTRVRGLRDRLANEILSVVPNCRETATFADSPKDRSHKIPGSCHLCFDGIESEALLFLLERENILASAASSCASGAQEPSHVLAAMGLPRKDAAGSLRLSLGYTSSNDDVDCVIQSLPQVVEQLRRTGS